MSAYSNVGSIPPTQLREGVVARAVHGDRVTLSVIELDPGATVPEHSHENEQVGILIEGTLSFEIGGEASVVTPGGTWCIPANVPHSVVAGPDGAALVEVFSPPRLDWHALPAAEPGPPRWPR